MKFVPDRASRFVGRRILIAQKHSPKLMLSFGIGGVIVSTFLACRATLKLEPALTGFKDDVDKVEDKRTSLSMLTYSPKAHRKELTTVYGKNVIRIARLYAPSVALGAVSIGAITGSHVVLSRRNAGLTAAYGALATSFDSYRDRVKEELGENAELDIRHNATVISRKNADETETIKVADPNLRSPYARFFDEYSTNWVKNAELNRVFVQCQQNYANHLLHARGHVFLNEVYDMLGIDRSRAGQVVGWVIGDSGDNFIDFGIFDDVNSGFVNGWERSVLLDFNVDGVIYNKI